MKEDARGGMRWPGLRQGPNAYVAGRNTTSNVQSYFYVTVARVNTIYQPRTPQAEFGCLSILFEVYISAFDILALYVFVFTEILR